MIGLALAAALAAQDMTRDDLIAEGEAVGRSSVAMGLCGRLGYTVYQSTGEGWAADFGERAIASGWSEDVALAAIRMGAQAETAELNFDAPEHRGDDAAFRAEVGALFGQMKARCHRLAAEHAGLISNLERGDRNADAEMAILLSPLDQP
jgi:hypothetical protein